LCIAAAVALAIAPAAIAGEMVQGSLVSGKVERTVSLAVPSDLEATSEPVPLLILLHGSGRDGASLVSKWRKLAEKEGFLVAGPDSKNPQYWSAGQDGPDLLRDLVDHLAESWPVDRRRVYLFGHSAGAVFTLQMALLESRYFAAAALHAGVLSPGTESWLPSKASRKIPFYVVVGTEDPYFPLATVRATRDVLTAAELPVELVEIHGHDHNYYGKSSRINREVWTFLSGHRLEEGPVYERRVFH
jgi:poly(3-hydroxybutyrate) depolymerase